MTSYTQIDGNWHSSLTQTHALSTGRSLMPKNVQMTLGEGRLSDDIRSVAPKRAIAVDVTTSAQIALHLPAPISVDIRL